jgi:NADH-quinone oxidoreductase subunit H
MVAQSKGTWFAFAQPLGLMVFVVAAFAEAARLPFDLPECEQELVGGYHTEYAGIKLVLFLTAEFIHMITASFLIVILFLGGWHLWGLTGSGDQIGWGGAILRVAVMMLKIVAVIVFFMIVRWSWPRFRFDQLMALAWKVMLPLGIVNLMAVAVVSEWTHSADAAGAGTQLLVCLAGWVVAACGWAAVAMAGPLLGDNRPRVELQPYEIDSQI